METELRSDASPDSQAWWDVAVAEVADVEVTRAARTAYEKDKQRQRHYLASDRAAEEE